MPSQALDVSRDGPPATINEEPPNTAGGAGGEALLEPSAAVLRRNGRVFLRPEDLLTVAEVAERLGVTTSSVHNLINAGKLRCLRFGNARRVRPEDLEAHCDARAGARPPAGEDWRTVNDLVRLASVSRSLVYRLIKRGELPAKQFGMVYYVRGESFVDLVRSRGKQP
jgi:excisionase family DNA binding protein